MYQHAAALSKRVVDKAMASCEVLLQVGRWTIQLCYPLVGELLRKFRVQAGAYREDVRNSIALKYELIR